MSGITSRGDDDGSARPSRLLALVVLAAAVLLLSGSAGRAAPAALAAPAVGKAPAPAVGTASDALPPELAGLPAGTTQAIVVRSASAAATDGTVSAWTRTASGWTSFLAPTRAFLGREGMGPSSESAARTPEGTFGISRAFGRLPDPGTALPYRQVGPDDWWVGDTTSPLYNTRQVCAPGHCPFDEKASENLQAAGHAYDHAIVIDANTDPVRPGAGSAYFLHIGDHPTAGCVATDQADVVTLLRWLRPGARIVLAS